MTTFEFLPPARLLSQNDREHWRPRAARVKLWRTAAYYGALKVPFAVRKHGPSVVTIELPVKGNRRRDPGNAYPTLKACVDGAVDAGIWPDDNSEWVTVNEPVLNIGGTTVRVTIEPRNT